MGWPRETTVHLDNHNMTVSTQQQIRLSRAIVLNYYRPKILIDIVKTLTDVVHVQPVHVTSDPRKGPQLFR